MPTLYEMRHSAAHVLAQAILQRFPDANLGIGPVIDDGFYYDFDLPQALSEEDFVDLEARMKAIIQENQTFKQYDLSRAEATDYLQKRNQNFKVELIEDLNLPTYSFYENGPFVDLCRGPHVESTAEIGCVKLLRVSGAYWRGSEKNKMLTRIYGTAFATQTEVDDYLHKIEEAKKRDHRTLGKALDLFSVHDNIGGGLILWHPKGGRVRYLIEEHWRRKHFEGGYEIVYTPHVGRADLWKTSGHLDFYSENMFSPIEIEEQPYYLKPMNCPFHIMIYKNHHHSYRDLPLRYAELGTVYRYERSGVLHGLMRVRGFTQDDAHIMCTRDQMDSEIMRVFKFCMQMLSDFGFENFKIYLSTRPEKKYVGDLSQWKEAEAALEKAIQTMNVPYEVDHGGGAFYGPKIDIKIQDAIQREWQCSTIQFDFNLPEKFDMTYIGSDGQKHRPYMVHRALLGSIERFFGVLVEHYAGRFPFWLAPTQVKLLSISEEVQDYAKEVQKRLEAEGFRVEIDASNEKLGAKIRDAIAEKVPYMGVIGKKEKEAGKIALRQVGEQNDVGQFTIDELVAHLQKEHKPDYASL